MQGAALSIHRLPTTLSGTMNMGPILVRLSMMMVVRIRWHQCRWMDLRMEMQLGALV
ncbi:hypothetical protein LINGRAHAP2_LOCUS10541 [Linum grandiflorum]